MEQYKFPLQKLLDIRSDKEDESKRNFMEAQRQRGIAEEKLTMLKENYKKFNVEKHDDDVVARKIKENYLRALSHNIVESKNELQKRIEHVEIQREDLKLKQIDRKTVESLKHKRYEAFKKELEDKEQKSNDEFALYSYIRKSEGR